MADSIESEILAETENFIVWRAIENGGGFVYHLEMGGITLHLLPEEWEELVAVIRSST